MEESKPRQFSAEFISQFLKSPIKENLFFENPYIGIVITDAEGTILTANDSYARITHRDIKKAIGRNMKESLIHGVIQESSTFSVLAAKKEVMIEQAIYGNKSFIAHGVPAFDHEGTIRYVISFLVNTAEIVAMKQKLSKIEQEKELIKNEMERLQNILKSSSQIIYRSKQMQNVVRLADIVSKTDSSILITGETGVGKEVVARYIHEISNRKNDGFVIINCEAIPKTLLEAELFGYSAGAFTGASKEGKTGLLKEADGGTVFFDEIGELSLDVQVKLLNFLQSHTIRKLGSRSEEKVDVRVIAATNADLPEMIEEKKFRQDLYYRLNVIPIHIAPLRERKEDIPFLVQRYVEKFNEKYDRKKTFSLRAYNELSLLEYKGNVRELENLVERLILLSSNDVIDVEDIANCMDSTPVSVARGSFKDQMNAMEKNILERCLEKHGSFNKVAQELGLDASTVFRKLKKYGLK